MLVFSEASVAPVFTATTILSTTGPVGHDEGDRFECHPYEFGVPGAMNSHQVRKQVRSAETVIRNSLAGIRERLIDTCKILVYFVSVCSNVERCLPWWLARGTQRASYDKFMIARLSKCGNKASA